VYRHNPDGGPDAIMIEDGWGKKMHDAEHVSLDRMVEVTRNRSALFNDAEEEHVRHCDQCLMMFTRLVLNKPLDGAG
jgi:hypothetical protein